MKFILNQIAEIQNDWRLRVYGACLTATHFFTYIFWSGRPFWHHHHWGNTEPICWSYFQSCHEIHPFLERFGVFIFNGYLLAAVGAFVAFLLLKRQVVAYGLFALALVLKFAIFSTDYRMMGNYHYMSIILCAAFLLLPHKMTSLRMVVVSFYIGAGLIKFNSDWLSGAAMLRPPIIQGKMLEWATAFVILLEIGLAPLLLFAEKAVRWAVLGLFIFFHLFSWHIVGWFYPSLMFLMLVIFVLVELPRSAPPLTARQVIRHPLNTTFFLLFFLAQLYPLVFEPGSALNGRGRILSLNMLDAKSVCSNHLFLSFKTGIIEQILQSPTNAVRVRCDPLFYLTELRKICEQMRKNPDFIDADFVLTARRISNPEEQETTSLRKVCRRALQVGFLGDVQ
jgi:hypothetical protein